MGPTPWLEFYCFTLRATITQTFIGEIPAGFRVDLQYDPEKALNCDFTSKLSSDEQDVLKGAELLTGTDWVSITTDGLVSFDTRITLRVGPNQKNPDERCVISASVRGRADLAAVRNGSDLVIADGHDQRDQILPRWQKGFPPDSYLPLALSAIIDVPTQGNDDGQNKIYEKCRNLERGLFVAFGRAVYMEGPNSPLDSIRLDFFRPDIPAWSSQPEQQRDDARKTNGEAIAVDGETTGSVGGTA